MVLAPRRLASMIDDLFTEPRLWSMVPRIAGEGDTQTSAMMQWRPTCDVCETDRAYVIQAEVPGAKKEDIKVELDGQRLKISGKVHQESTTETDRFHSQERSFGYFSRAFTLPQNSKLDQIVAKHENGILQLTIPKYEQEQMKMREVKID